MNMITLLSVKRNPRIITLRCKDLISDQHTEFMKVKETDVTRIVQGFFLVGGCTL